MKKFLSFCLAAMFLFLCGCENVEYIEQVPEESDVTSEQNIYDKIEQLLPPVVNDSGDNSDENSGTSSSQPSTPAVVQKQPFTIVTDDADAFYQSEATAGTISNALEERNSFLKDVYGAEITVVEKDFDVLFEELQKAVEEGKDYCDMISVSAENTVKLYEAGLLEDINSLPGFDLESGFFKENWAKPLATNNSLYMIADPTNLVYDDVYVMFYNRDLISEEVETLVQQGEWTWAKFDELSRAAAQDVYIHSSADMDKDIFAFSIFDMETIFPLAMWTSCGQEMVKNTYKNPVSVGMTKEEVIPVAEYLMEVYNVKGKYPLSGESALNAFKEGRAAFFCGKLELYYALREEDEGDNFAVLPMPKYSEEQKEYNSMASVDARVISVPKTLSTANESRRKFVSTVISATCATGSETMCQAYINSKLGLYIYNNSELVVLNMICDSVTFDFSVVYGSVLEVIATPTINAIADYLDYGSKLSSSLRQGKRAFDQYCADNFN